MPRCYSKARERSIDDDLMRLKQNILVIEQSFSLSRLNMNNSLQSRTKNLKPLLLSTLVHRLSK